MELSAIKTGLIAPDDTRAKTKNKFKLWSAKKVEEKTWTQ